MLYYNIKLVCIVFIHNYKVYISIMLNTLLGIHVILDEIDK